LHKRTEQNFFKSTQTVYFLKLRASLGSKQTLKSSLLCNGTVVQTLEKCACAFVWILCTWQISLWQACTTYGPGELL